MNMCVARRRVRRLAIVCLGLLLLSAVGWFGLAAARSDAAEPEPSAQRAAGDSEEAARRAEADLSAPSADPEPGQQPSPDGKPKEPERIRLLVLLTKGGPLMWPILAMSLLAVTFGIEPQFGVCVDRRSFRRNW